MDPSAMLGTRSSGASNSHGNRIVTGTDFDEKFVVPAGNLSLAIDAVFAVLLAQGVQIDSKYSRSELRNSDCFMAISNFGQKTRNLSSLFLYCSSDFRCDCPIQQHLCATSEKFYR